MLISKSLKIFKKIKKTETTEPKEELQIKSPTNLLQLKRYLTVIDSDLMFSKLKGFKRDFYEKKMSYDKKIKSPEFGIKEFYSNSTANDGKLDFMHFIKSIEMICLKLYPEYSLEISLRYLWIHHLSVLLKTLEKNKIDERTVGTNKAEMLTELLQNKDIVRYLYIKMCINFWY